MKDIPEREPDWLMGPAMDRWERIADVPLRYAQGRSAVIRVAALVLYLPWLAVVSGPLLVYFVAATIVECFHDLGIKR
jgi:hypothetical protein